MVITTTKHTHLSAPASLLSASRLFFSVAIAALHSFLSLSLFVLPSIRQCCRCSTSAASEPIMTSIWSHGRRQRHPDQTLATPVAAHTHIPEPVPPSCPSIHPTRQGEYRCTIAVRGPACPALCVCASVAVSCLSRPLSRCLHRRGTLTVSSSQSSTSSTTDMEGDRGKA